MAAIQYNNFSNYIHTRCPERFGEDNQADYIARSNEAIDIAVDVIKHATQNGDDLEELFHQTIAQLAETRHQIAVDHKTHFTEHAGMRRDQEILPSVAPMTFMTHPYDAYGKKIITTFAEQLSPLKRNLKEYQEKALTIEEKCLGRISRYKFEVLDAQDLHNRGWAHIALKPDGLQQVEAALNLPLSSADIDMATHAEKLTSHLLSKADLQTIKTNNPPLYTSIKMGEALTELVKTFPSPIKTPDGRSIQSGNTDYLKSIYIVGTPRLQVNKKLYALSPHMTWQYCNWREDPVERMKRCSEALVIHQDVFLVEPMLQDMAKLFKEAIEWNGEDVKALKDRVGLLRYEFAHAMPYIRGSSAIGENLEKTIYRYHEFSVYQDADKLVDLEALSALLLSHFMETYHSMTHLSEPQDQ